MPIRSVHSPVFLDVFDAGEVVYFPKVATENQGPTTGLSGWVMNTLGVPGWGQILLVVLAGAFVAGGGALWSGYSKLNKIDAAVRVLASKLPDVKDLVRELLAQANSDVSTGQIARAEKAV